MFRFRRSRGRRVLAAAFVPYLFLSMFVDFVHVHPLGAGIETAGSRFEAVLTSHGSTTPDKSCAVCQWLRADTGLQTPITSAVVTDLVATDLVSRSYRHPVQTVVLTRDLRGPPRQPAV